VKYDFSHAKHQTSPSVQAAMRVFGDRNLDNEPDNDDRYSRKWDLSDICLVGVDLFQAKSMRNSYLVASTLLRMNLRETNLAGADLTGITAGDRKNLGWGHEVRAALLDATRDNSGIESHFSTSFSGANMNNVILFNAGLEGANFRYAMLTEAKLNGANISRADFRHSDITPEQLVTAACSDEDNHDPPLLDPEISERTVTRGGIEGCVGELGRKQVQAK
jgi:uncharacterized protein YjbI with pentapeptide repeats